MRKRSLLARKLTHWRHRVALADTPWTTSSMSADHDRSSAVRKDGSTNGNGAALDPTVAAFSPHQQTVSRTLNRSSILIHQKSPLLVATPPQVTRALAYSHPFILPMNRLVGLLSWTSGDPWESFLLLVVFWFLALYTDTILQWAFPLVVVATLIFGMYSRRYSPLSSTAWDGANAKRKRANSDARKSLDEILETLNEFTRRCDVLLDPLLRLTEYLSTQSSATSATTRPALTTLLIRVLAFTPIWIGLTMSPLRIVSSRRIVLSVGTIILTWHSRPANACRTILWRSRTIRSALCLLTGLRFPGQTASSSSSDTPPALPPRVQAATNISTKVKTPHPGIRFTFSIYENQRRWLGLGWTPTLLPGESEAWTDEHQHAIPDPQHYELPEPDNDTTRWRWVAGSAWYVDDASSGSAGNTSDHDAGWTYYDNYWRDARRTDGFSRYTRRRKWCRDAELVEADIVAGPAGDDDAVPDAAMGDDTPMPTPRPDNDPIAAGTTTASTSRALTSTETPSSAAAKQQQRSSWFLRRRQASTSSNASAPDHTDGDSIASSRRSRTSGRDDNDRAGDGVRVSHETERSEWDRSVNEGVWEGLS